MTDLEMTRLCAEALDLLVEYDHSGVRLLVGNDVGGYNRYDYDPLHNDTQAMALHKRFLLDTLWDGSKYTVYVWKPNIKMKDRIRATHTDLNRAIVECVAKMQKEKITT